MAANYWDSTQRTYWTFTKDQLDDIRNQQQKDNQELHNKYPLPEPRLMNIYIQQRKLAASQIYIAQLINTRNREAWSKNECQTATTCHSSGLRTAILYQSRHSEDKSIPRHDDSCIRRLQGRGMSDTHQIGLGRGS
jgi:hypothetical protein